MTIGERIRHELREIGLVTAFFLLWFLFFLTLKRLVLAQYEIEVSVLGTALIGALVVAKVVVILDKLPVARRFRGGALALHLLWRTLSYTAVVFLVMSAERLFHAWRETGALRPALAHVWASRDLHHALATTLAVGSGLALFLLSAEVDRRLGEGGLRRLLFARRSA